MRHIVLFVFLIAVLLSFHTGHSVPQEVPAQASLQAKLRVSVGAKSVPQEVPAQASLQAKLRVSVGAKLELSCQFLLPGQADQKFASNEYRYAVLDKDGNQVDNAVLFKSGLRTISLPKDMQSVTDKTTAIIVADKLKSGEEYYFVVSVRDRMGLAKFKAP